MSHKRLVLALLPVALMLGACGQMSTPTTSKDLVTVTLKTPFGQKVTTQGLPGLNGAPVVNSFKVKVYPDGETTPLLFNDQNVADDNGTRDHLEFSPAQSSISILVPQGEYDIETIGKMDNTDNGVDDGLFLAYGMDQANLTGTAPSVNLKLHTLASEENTTSEWRGAANAVDINEQLEALLSVRTAAFGEGDTAPVPSADFAVSYRLNQDEENNPIGTIDSASKLGVKATTPSDYIGADFRVHVDVSAWVATGPEKAEFVEDAFSKTVIAQWD